MRTNAPFSALVAMGLVLFAPAAHAVTHRAPAKAVRTVAPKNAAAKNVSSKAATGKGGKKNAEPAGKRREVASARKEAPSKANSRVKLTKAEARAEARNEAKAGRHGREEAPKLIRVHGKLVPAKPEKTRAEKPAPRLEASHKQAVAPAAPARLARLETPAVDLPTGPEPHVTHNRKAHLEAEPPASVAPSAASSAAPGKKATTADFLKMGVSHPPSDDEAAPRKANAAAADSAPIASVVMLPPMAPVPTADVAVVESPKVVPELYNKRGRLMMPPPLKGSHEILVRQNVNADHDGLERVQDDEDLIRMRTAKLLVALPLSSSLEVDERLPANRRYARPWTAQFLADMAREHYARFHTSLQVNSAVRTVTFQVRLIRTNGNAAPAEGDTASPHLTGQAVDLAKKGLSLTEIAWMRGYLLPLVQQGKVDVEEEFQQSCFHISVYKKYMPSATPRRIVTTHRGSATSLAAAMQ